MVFMLLVGTALLAAAPQETAQAPTDPALLAEYNGLKAGTPDTADGHWKLGLWCEQKGLKPEAEVEFLAVTTLDPRRDSAWKKLGYQKENGRWMSAEQAALERAETETQRKSDAHWRPLLQKWKGWLGQKSKRAEAAKLLAEVDDPRAVPSIWKVFVGGGPADQERAVDMLGHIEGVPPSKALAGVAVFGKTA